MNSPFLTKDNARLAVMIAKSTLQQMSKLRIPNKEVPLGYFVVLDATAAYDPNRPLHEHLLFENPVARKRWEPGKEYDKIAWGKAFLSYRTRMDTWTVITQHPELLMPNDVRFGGGVFLEPGIVVAYSGLQWWVDEWLARMVANNLLYLAAAEARIQVDLATSTNSAFIA